MVLRSKPVVLIPVVSAVVVRCGDGWETRRGCTPCASRGDRSDSFDLSIGLARGARAGLRRFGGKTWYAAVYGLLVVADDKLGDDWWDVEMFGAP